MEMLKTGGYTFRFIHKVELELTLYVRQVTFNIYRDVVIRKINNVSLNYIMICLKHWQFTT